MSELTAARNFSQDIHSYQSRRAAWLVDRDCALPIGPEVRKSLRVEFLRSMGLEPMPPRGDPGERLLGTLQGSGYTVKKFVYQLLPDCWGSAHYYCPATADVSVRLPAVLYACGHSDPGVIHFRSHAIAWARRGYACLIFDTMQQHGNPGDHHGLNLGQTPEWIALGFSAAGGELFNGLRALDLLWKQPEVDPDRVGVTGISGGGSQSFFLAIAEPRLAAVATVAGVSDPACAIPNGHLEQHCDCIYLRNLFGRDMARFASLIAPRALLYCFARHDLLFTPGEFRALHARTCSHFEALGCPEKCALVEYDGPHGYNHASTTDAIHEWFDRHVAGEAHPPVDTLALEPGNDDPGEDALYHNAPPSPNHLHLLPELLSPRGSVDLPGNAAEWPGIKAEAIERLNQEVFPLLDAVMRPQTLEQTGDWLVNGGQTRRWRWHGTLDGMGQVVMALAPTDVKHERVVVAVGGREKEALHLTGAVWVETRGAAAVVGIQPRGCGLSSFSEAKRNHCNREGCLTGMTPTMLMVQDLCCLWPFLAEFPMIREREVILYGSGEGALAVLYHALLHPQPQTAAVILEDLPHCHTKTGFQIMGVLRVLNLPQAVGLLAPLPVALINPGGTDFHWHFATRAHARVGRLLMADSLGDALQQLRPATGGAA